MYNPPRLPLATYFQHVHKTTTHQLSFIIQLYKFYTTIHISLFSGTMTTYFNNVPTAPEIITGVPQIQIEIYTQEIMLAPSSRHFAIFINCRISLKFEWTKRGGFKRIMGTHIKKKEVQILCFLFKRIFALNFLGFIGSKLKEWPIIQLGNQEKERRKCYPSSPQNPILQLLSFLLANYFLTQTCPQLEFLDQLCYWSKNY